MNRRNFFKASIAAVSSLLLFPVLFKKGSAFGADKKPLSAKDPVAQTLGYNPDNTKVDIKKWPKKSGADRALQKCQTCMFFTKIDGTHGNCQIFPNNTVLRMAGVIPGLRKPKSKRVFDEFFRTATDEFRWVSPRLIPNQVLSPFPTPDNNG